MKILPSSLTGFLNTIKDSRPRDKNLKEEKSSKTTGKALNDYTAYDLSIKELRDYYILAFCCALCLGLLFYESLWASLLLLCISVFFEKKYADYLCIKQKNEILSGFRDSLYVISASISAGRQLPAAIEDASENAAALYGEDSIIGREFLNISSVYSSMNTSVDVLLSDFAKRTGIEEIALFADSIRICQYTGGDIERVCLKSAYMLIEKIEYNQEVSAILAEKKLDIWLLLLMPVAVLFFLNLSSADYVSVLYSGLKGRIIMTMALLLMGLAGLWSIRIMKLDL